MIRIIESYQDEDGKLLTSAFPVYGQGYAAYLRDDVRDRLINFLRYDVIGMPKNCDMSIVEYLLDDGQIDSAWDATDYIKDWVNDLEPEYFPDPKDDCLDSSKLFCLGYLKYGEDCYNIM